MTDSSSVSGPATPYPAVLALGRHASFCLPAMLYHGTSSGCVADVLREGLRPDIPAKQSMLSRSGVYLITDVTMAASIARSRAFRHGDEPVVLAIDARALDPDRLDFDLNMSGPGWSESLAYAEAIPASALQVLPLAVALQAALPMILGEPVPGDKPLAFHLDGPRGEALLACVSLGDDDQARLLDPTPTGAFHSAPAVTAQPRPEVPVPGRPRVAARPR